MKRVGMAMILFAGLCCWAQERGDFRPSATNVWGADYPRIDSAGRVEVRVKAPDATKVKLNFWSGPKIDMVKQSDGFWTVTAGPLVPGFHYYTLIMDGAEVSDPGTHTFWRGRAVSALKSRKRDQPTTCFKMCHTARCARTSITRR